MGFLAPVDKERPSSRTRKAKGGYDAIGGTTKKKEKKKSKKAAKSPKGGSSGAKKKSAKPRPAGEVPLPALSGMQLVETRAVRRRAAIYGLFPYNR